MPPLPRRAPGFSSMLLRSPILPFLYSRSKMEDILGVSTGTCHKCDSVCTKERSTAENTQPDPTRTQYWLTTALALCLLLETCSKILLIPLFNLFCISQTVRHYCVHVGPPRVLSGRQIAFFLMNDFVSFLRCDGKFSPFPRFVPRPILLSPSPLPLSKNTDIICGARSTMFLLESVGFCSVKGRGPYIIRITSAATSFSVREIFPPFFSALSMPVKSSGVHATQTSPFISLVSNRIRGKMENRKRRREIL